MNASFASKCWLLVLIELACLGADEYRQVPKFAGKSIPDPPRQKVPWTPPQTKLPKFLVSATTALFEQGMADPRGCEYRKVEIGEGTILKTRGFVLPEREGDACRFVISWDGVVYPALSVGAVADLDKDIHTLVESMNRDRESASAKNATRFGDAGMFFSAYWRGDRWRGGGPSGVDGRSPLKLCLLLRLGRADLAEVLFAGGTSWTPEVRGRDLTDYHISYLTLAMDWAAAVFTRLVTAHVHSDDAIALDAARRLSAFAKTVETKADAMGFQRGQGRYDDEAPSYLPFLRQLPGLLADHERRAKEPKRGPIPQSGGEPSARVAALIRDFDQIDEKQMSSPGSAYPGGSPLVRELIAEGDPAVEPLLTALETDMRLTRSVSFGRGMSIDRTVHPVLEAEIAALEGILKTSEFRDARYGLRQNDLKGRKELARAMRAFWIKNRAISLNERWYRTLRDDAAGRDRWFEAAGGIVEASDNAGLFAAAGPRQPTPRPMKGEELRSRRDPSVSALLVRRISEITRSGDPLSMPDINLHAACQLALILNRWDSKAARPILRALMTQCLDGIDLGRKQNGQADQGLARFVSQFTMIRARSDDHAALDQYAAWVRKTDPKELEHQDIACFEPLWTYPDYPAIAEAARWLFNDPKSPWVPLLRAPGSRMMFFFYNGSFFTSPLVRVAGFRDGLLAAMAVKSEMGTVRRGDRGTFQYKMSDGGSGGFGSNKADLDAFKPGVDIAFRVCDYLGWQVSFLEGAPECELYWPEDRRDRAVEASAAFVRRYGDRFTAEAPGGERDFPSNKGHVAFPILGRPATLDDVREARAIFSLEGQGEGEIRTAKVPELPIQARWITLKDFPVEYQNSDGTVRREYDQDGWIWQAEEIRKGDHWERSYGFVGRHVIARVPASEIELAIGRFTYNTWGTLSSGLDARVEPVEPRDGGYEPGRPILMALRIRNRRGVENSATTEVLRRGADGQPALRRGVTLAVFYSAPSLFRTGPGQGQPGPGEELKPKRTDRFDPGANDATRPLAAFEAFEMMRLDLNDWFDLSRPGSYRVHVKFAAGSSVGEGEANPWYFTVAPLQ
jgi:hypothetical protein